MVNNLKLAIEASLKAGNEIMKVYNLDIKVAFKADDSPLTIADLNANKEILSYLLPTNIPIISEENKQVDYSVRKKWDKCWIVDPLDGTKEFINKNQDFTVNIALVSNGIPELGVIYVPYIKTIYVSDVKNKIAFKAILNTHDTSVEDVVTLSENLEFNTEKSETIKVVGSRSHMNDDTKNYIEDLKNKNKKIEMVSRGSSLKFCLVAEGKADVYPRFGPTMEWDTAAGQAICEAVGYKVLDIKTKKSIVYNRENLLNNYFLVTK